MEKYITYERTGLKYELVSDYYLIAAAPSIRSYRTFCVQSPSGRVHSDT